MATLEERVAALESEVMRLKGQLQPTEDIKVSIPNEALLSDEEIRVRIERIRREEPLVPRPTPTSPDFLDRFAGIFADDPTFPDVVRYSEEKRERERQAVNRGK
jgi:hypothetical protein